jgi:hypothetical protein
VARCRRERPSILVSRWESYVDRSPFPTVIRRYSNVELISYQNTWTIIHYTSFFGVRKRGAGHTPSPRAPGCAAPCYEDCVQRGGTAPSGHTSVVGYHSALRCSGVCTMVDSCASECTPVQCLPTVKYITAQQNRNRAVQ